MNAPRLRALFAPVAKRIFTPEYQAIVAGIPFEAVPASKTDDAIRLLATLCISNSKLRAFVSTADEAVLAAVYHRHLQVEDWLSSRPFHMEHAGTMTDGALLRFLLVDLYSTLPPF